MKRPVALLLVLALFVVGVAVGVLGTHLYYAHQLPDPGGGSAIGGERFVQRLERELELTVEQRQRIDEIMEARRTEGDALHREMLPRMRKDPDYLGPRNLEIVAGGGADAKTYPPTEENLERLAEGELRVRQRPGPSNSLGLVKFIFPNSHSVYLHSTPAQQLFERTRRDFSHGCIRVEDPVALATWLLDDPAWSPESVTKAMEEGENRRVDLSAEVPVYLFYTTFLAEEDGNILLLDDIYGHDARLEAWLRDRYPYRAASG